MNISINSAVVTDKPFGGWGELDPHPFWYHFKTFHTEY